MRIALSFLGVLLVLSGGVFFFQGINLIPGSFMTGQTRWAVYGALFVMAGVALLVFANRRKT
jgi:drug/metabolite transporter superfamily protein YnfA